VMYAVLGVIFALIGKQFGAILGNPYVVVPLVVFYAAFAASMFGAFELNLPASWQARLSQVGGRGYGGAFGMGLVGGLTAAPCTGPFLAGILGFVAATRNVPVGSTLLFTYALGMGILFWLIAAFAVSLPKGGRWMEWAKSIGGIALLTVGVFFLRGIIPALASVP
jgi:thioredoxin:protein disulfide reductase